MNDAAKELNRTLSEENPYVLHMLSDLGRELFYPKGVLTQSAEAKAGKYNATIGIATSQGESMHFSHIQETLSAYNPDDIYDYAPPQGKEPLRQEWLKNASRKSFISRQRHQHADRDKRFNTRAEHCRRLVRQ